MGIGYGYSWVLEMCIGVVTMVSQIIPPKGLDGQVHLAAISVHGLRTEISLDYQKCFYDVINCSW